MKNAQKGFTLVEVVISFAVLAVVSGALLQMFVVSTNVNRRAYDTDKANALAVRIQEAFKQNPALVDPDDLTALKTAFPELGNAVTDSTDPDHPVISAELNLEWGASAGAADDAFEVQLKKVSANPGDFEEESSGYYPEETDPDPEWVLDTAQNDLSFALVGPDIQASMGGKTVLLGENHSLILHYGADGGTGTFKTLNVTNSTDVYVRVYVVEVPERESPSDLPLVVNPIEGPYECSEIGSQTGKAAADTLTVTITRKSDGTDFAVNQSMRYLPAAAGEG